MIQNTADIIHITNTSHQKRKDIVKKKFILIYSYNKALITLKQRYDCFTEIYCFTAIDRTASQSPSRYANK